MDPSPELSPRGEPSTPRSEKGGSPGAASSAVPVLPAGALDAFPVPALEVTADGVVAAANLAFARTWGDAGGRRLRGERLASIFASGGVELLDGARARGAFACDGRALLADGSEAEFRLEAQVHGERETGWAGFVVLASDVTATRRLERAATVLGSALDAGPADGFFARLAEGLANALRMEIVVVGRLEAGAAGRVRALAVRVDGGPAEPFTYDLRGAPCERVVGRTPCVFASGVAETFPEDGFLAINGLSSYVGVPLMAADGTPLGLLAALSRRPLHDGGSAARTLGLFAARAASEIERREARGGEERREEESRRLLASIPVGIHRYRLEGGERLVFTGANPAADAILGIENAQLVGLTIEEAFPMLAGTPIPAAYRRAAAEGEPWRSEEVVYADSRVAGAFLAQAFQTAPGEMAVAFLDITARRRAEEALRERELRLERLNGVLRASTRVREILAAGGEAGGLFSRVCSALVEERDYDFAWIGLLDESGCEVRLAGASGPCDPGHYAIDLRTLHGGTRCGREAFLTGTAVHVDSDAGDTICRECPVSGGRPVMSALAMPLWRGDRALGVLVVHAPAARAFDVEEDRLVAELADSLAAAAERMEAEAHRAEARRDRAFREDVASAALREESLPSLLGALAGALEARLSAAGVVVALWDGAHGRVALASGRGVFAGIGPDDPTLAAEAARLVGEAAGPGDAGGGHPSRLLESGGATIWPLRDGADLVGVVAAAFTAPIPAAALAAAADAAGPLSLALAKARLHEANRERVATLLAIHETGVDLGSSPERDALLRAIVERARGLARATTAGLYLRREDGRLELVFADGRLARYKGALLSPGEGVAGSALLTREPVLLDDYATWPGRSPLFPTEGIAAVIGVPVLWRGEVLGCLFVIHEVPGRFGATDVETVRLFAEQAAVAIANAGLIGELQGAADELAAAYDATLEGWVRALDLRDKETEGHTQRVVQRTVDLARRAGLPEETMVHLRRGALLHDIGKVGIPDRILQKPGPLTEDEWAVMRRHPGYAHDMLSGIAFLRPALDIPWAHHERWDGSGYPRGLRGEEIPIAARIFAVVDIWDALRFDRPYRKSLPAAEVRDYLRKIAGTHLEPRLVELFLAGDPD